MFNSRKKWGTQTLKALLISTIMYRLARYFMKSAAKDAKVKKVSGEKGRKKNARKNSQDFPVRGSSFLFLKLIRKLLSRSRTS